MTTKAEATETLADAGYLNPQQAADLLGVHCGTLSNWRGAGTGPPFYRVHARAVVYLRKDIDAWIASRRVTPAPVPTLANPTKRQSLRARA